MDKEDAGRRHGSTFWGLISIFARVHNLDVFARVHAECDDKLFFAVVFVRRFGPNACILKANFGAITIRRVGAADELTDKFLRRTRRP
jgi:hypothetical protein